MSRKWDTIIENYESNDCESLGEYAEELLEVLFNYFRRFENEDDSAYDTLLCAIYFLDIDNFVDGGEEDVFRYALDRYHKYNIPLLQKQFRSQGLNRRVESNIYNAPYNIKEAFARLGCALCSGKGYVSSQEREVILKWVD